MAATLLLPPRPSIGGFVNFCERRKTVSSLRLSFTPGSTQRQNNLSSKHQKQQRNSKSVTEQSVITALRLCRVLWLLVLGAARRLVNKGYGLISDCWRSIVSLSTSPFHAYAMRRFLCRGKQEQGKIKNCGNCCGQRETGIEWIYSQTWC